MSKAPASQFFWGDWLNDVELQSTCASTRGIWMNALARMWFSAIRGELIASPQKFTEILNCTLKEFKIFLMEVQRYKFCDVIIENNVTQNVTQKNVTRNADVRKSNNASNGIVTLRNRRMYKQEKARNITRLRVQRYRKNRSCNAECNVPSNASVTVPSSSSIKEYKETNLVTAKNILSYLNEISGKKFTATEANLTPIIARLKEGHTEEECRKVIDIKNRDPDFQDKYFRPVTLFRASKFEGYLNEKPKENVW